MSEMIYNQDKPKLFTPKYGEYKNMLESQGYLFQYYEKPYDFYSNGMCKVKICEPCLRVIIINHGVENAIKAVSSFHISRLLMDHLFNKK